MLQGSESILIVKMSALGDVVQSLSFLAALKESFPDTRVSWLVDRANQDLLTTNPLLEEVIVFERQLWGRFRGGRSLVELGGFLKKLRGKRFDVVVDLQGLLRSGVVTLLSGAPLRVGFAGSREWTGRCYTNRVHVQNPDGQHAIDRYLTVARWLGCSATEPRFPLTWTDSDREEAESHLEECGLPSDEPYILLGPTARWESKRWPPESFALLSDELERRASLPRILIGGPGEEEVGMAVQRAAALPVHNLVGKTSLRALAYLLAKARLLVTNDSGPMHLAVAVGIPVLALFGPTRPHLCGPYGQEHRVLRASCRCATFRRSPRHCLEVRACLATLSVASVVEAALRVLVETERARPSVPFPPCDGTPAERAPPPEKAV